MRYKFDVYDYIVLVIVLFISVFIGLYHAIKAKYWDVCRRFMNRSSFECREGEEMKQYLTAGGEMSSLP
jgi:hypothetical protein